MVRQPVDTAGAVGRLGEHLDRALTPRPEQHPLTIRRPDGFVVDGWFEGEPGQRLPGEVPRPDVTGLLLKDFDRHSRTVGRDPGNSVAARLRGQGLFRSVSINPDQQPITDIEGVRQIHQGPILRDRRLVIPTVVADWDVFQHRHRQPGDLLSIGIERDRPESVVARKDDQLEDERP
jgi:hypothetical protein